VPIAERVTISVEGGVADVRLNRPDKLNALDLAMFEAIAGAAESLADNPSLRAVVLSGEGRAFCAGLDFEAFAAMAEGSAGSGGAGNGGPGNGGAGSRRDAQASGLGRLGRRDRGRITNLGQQVAWAWRELQVPTIAAIHGVALGGGLQIALGADLRLVAPDARLSVLEIRWGLIPDMTGTYVLPRLVGLDVAKELTWTGRMVEAEEAVRLGLATRMCEDPRTEALAMASELASKSPDAIRSAKRLLNRSDGSTPQQQFLDESVEMGALIGTANQRDAVMAWFEKRPPRFTDAGASR
jgi:enoyl-CoA hydratase/carnithine racemase